MAFTIINEIQKGAGKMAQCTALTQDQNLISSTHVWQPPGCLHSGAHAPNMATHSYT